jgi:hypothetical protein
MNARRSAICVAAALLIIAGCASSPDDESRRRAMEADIQDILELSLAEDGKPLRCLSDLQYGGFRALGEKHLLFTGRGDKRWVNTLRTRCYDLRHGSVLRVRSHSFSRLCDAHWGSWSTGMTCSLGKFYPVTESQVAEIEAVLRSR